MSSLTPLLTSTFFAFPSKLIAKSTNTPFMSRRPFASRTDQTHGFRVSCSVAPDDHENQQLILPESKKLISPHVDRRNLLVGFGGLYTASNFASLSVVSANPISAPNIASQCTDPNSGFNNPERTVRPGKCCPPDIGKKIKAFVFPEEKTIRMRWPAHTGSEENVEKYKKAVEAMRALPEDHPYDFNNQAKIHCAYCNGRYTQVENGFPDIEIQIHNSWLFFPFHRWYLYFHERILGKLIDDPTFALPYWNWDNPSGMIIPKFFVEKNDIDDKPNPLFNVYRDAHHLPPTIVDLTFDGTGRETKSDIQIACNLSTVYRDLVRNGGDTISFFGGKYVAGDAPFGTKSSSVGSVEAGSHTAIHKWVGDSKMPNGEDMGSFYSAGYDPLFYAHHANVDRMWELWKDLGLPGHVDPTDPDWLNASYVFYDENEDLVRVYNKDCINIARLKYSYQDSNPAWHTSRPPKHGEKCKVASRSCEDVIKVEQLEFPVHLDRILKVRVKRPAVNRTKAEKAKANEVLVINEITFNSNKFVKFDVFVGDILEECDLTNPCNPKYAGGFAQLPHPYLDIMFKDMYIISAARLGLTELLEDTNSESEEYAMVILVPRTGCDDLTFGYIKIELVPIV